jgi:hypothetical protein
MIFTRSARLHRNTYSVPVENGSCPTVSRTNATSPSASRRKSTGFVATMTLRPAGFPIMAQPLQRVGHPEANRDQRRGRRALQSSAISMAIDGQLNFRALPVDPTLITRTNGGIASSGSASRPSRAALRHTIFRCAQKQPRNCSEPASALLSDCWRAAALKLIWNCFDPDG